MDEYRAELLKTFVPIVLGIVAGVLSFAISDGVRSRDPLGITILVLLIYVNKFLLPKLGVSLEGKDWAGISFMAFASWYIVWTFLLNL
jgi:hypothetical protein